VVPSKLSVAHNLRFGLLLLAVAAGLSACATTAPTKPAATVSSSSGGYRQVVRNGQTLYCRTEKVTGTLFQEENCLTQAQMQAQEEDARRFAHDVQGLATATSSPNSH
jgi:hypothetical protein